MIDLNDLSPDELEAIARRKRENAETIAQSPSVQRAIAKTLYDEFRQTYDEAYLLPCSGDGGQLSVSAYGFWTDGHIVRGADAWVYPDGRAVVKHYMVKDLGPDGLGGRRTKHVAVPGRCYCTVAVR